MPKPKDGSLAADLLQGAGAIAKELYGADTKANRRRIYYLAARSKSGTRPPIFRQGSVLMARKSELRNWFSASRASGVQSAVAQRTKDDTK